MLNKEKIDGVTLFDGESFFIVAATQARKVQLIHPDDGAVAGVLNTQELSVMQLEDLIDALPGFALTLRALDKDNNVLAELTYEDVYE